MNRLLKTVLMGLLITLSLNASVISYINKTYEQITLKDELDKTAEIVDFFKHILKESHKFKESDKRDIKSFTTSFICSDDREKLENMSDRELENYMINFIKIADNLQKKIRVSEQYLEIKDYGDKIEVIFRAKMFSNYNVKVMFKRVNKKLYIY